MNVTDSDVNKDDEKYISSNENSVRNINFEDSADEKNDDDCFKNYVYVEVIDTIVNAT